MVTPKSERVSRSLDALTDKKDNQVFKMSSSGSHTTEPFKITLTHMITIHNQLMNTIFFNYLSIY